ncbi:glycosyl hydrolase catalytic core-domain-containing protein [Stachybotrys elegans]|uniref:Glycosyl hydrolase catalytic core-domain-containing protein n=1 Tax=Stachybotrys elegans TaxID=80388 RepID=A0A8K0SG09_9HYPO|nr:glycosyl hydrolase catalytic core-domain-containing protein [Stachybotrys elegans]
MKLFAVVSLAALVAGLPTSGDTPKTLSARANDVPFGNKKGLAYNDGNAIRALSRPGSATWAYNWGPALDAPAFQGIPMCWGATGECNANGIMAKIDRGDTPWVLGYNEPDMNRDQGGCNLRPSQAYDAWGNDMFKFQQRGARLVCPAISSYDTANSQFTGYASGLTWLRQFAYYRNNPWEFRCDAQALHWYGVEGRSGRDQAYLFIDYMNRAHALGSPIRSIYGRAFA